MKFESVLTSSKWSILEALSHGDHAPAEIAALTKTSLPNVSQQTKLLEAYDLIRPRKEERQSPGKPRTIYTLGKPIGHIAIARHGFAAKRTIALDDFHAAAITTLFLERADDHYYLQKYLFTHEELISACQGIAVVDARGDEIHLLLLAQEEKLEHLRSKYSKVVVRAPHSEKQRAVIAWTHSVEEIKDGLARKDAYFSNLLKKPLIILEKDDAFREIMER